MNLASLPRIICAATTLGVLSTLCVTAATIRPVWRTIQTYRLVDAGARSQVRPEFTCPVSYYFCVTPVRRMPYTDVWCFSSSGNCGSGLYGVYEWSAVVSRVGRSRSYKRVRATWSPDPANPSTLTVADNRRAAKGTKVIASVSLTSCSVSTGSCFSDFDTIGVTN